MSNLTSVFVTKIDSPSIWLFPMLKYQIKKQRYYSDNDKENTKIPFAKKCPKCMDWKSSEDFHSGKYIGGKTCWCRKCMSHYRTDEKNKMRRRTQNRIDPRQRMIEAARVRAKQKNIECSLKKEDISVPEYCPVLGIKLLIKEGRPTDNSPSLDRINLSKGYIVGNIMVISYRANRLKSDASAEELYSVAAYIEKYGIQI